MRKITEITGRYCVDLWRSHVKPAFSADWDLLAIILLLSLALRIYFAFVFNGNLTLGFGQNYVLIAESGRIDALQAPLYPFFLRVLLFIFGSKGLTAVFVLQSIISSAGLLLVYFITSRLCGRRAGLIAAALGAIYPDFILYNLSATPGSLELFFILVIMASGISGIGHTASSVISSASLALCILLDPVMVFLLPGSIIAARKRLVFLLVLAGLIMPWALRNSFAEGRPVPVYDTAAYHVDVSKYSPNNLEGRWHTIRRIYNNASLITGKSWGMTDDPGSGASRDSTYAAGYAFTFVMLFGFMGLARHYRKGHGRVVLPAVIYAVLLILFTVFLNRFRIPIEPLFVIYAGALAGGCKSGISPAADDSPDPHNQHDKTR